MLFRSKAFRQKKETGSQAVGFPLFQFVSHSGLERFFTPDTMPIAAKSVTIDDPP